MNRSVIALLAALLLMTAAGCNGSSSGDAILVTVRRTQAAYENCVEETMREGDRQNQGRIPPELNRRLAEAACEVVRTECESNPEGPVCQAFLRRYGEGGSGQ